MQAFSPGALDDASLAELVSTASSEPVIDETYESELTELCREGRSDALATLVRANLRVAIDEAIRDRGLGESQADMVRRGLQAIVEAARLYDPERDGPFSSYARGAVRRAIRERYAPH